MDIDELKAGWAELDRRVAALEAVSPPSGRAAAGVRAELRPLRWGQTLQVIAGLVLAVQAGSFWVDHRSALGPLVAGLLLHAYGIAMIITAARSLVLIALASDQAPVLDLQRRVADLRAWRLREGRGLGLAGCLMWVPLVISAFALLGVDIVAARPLFVGWLVVSALVCVSVFVLVSRLIKAPAGGAVERARERLDEVARFRATD